VGCLLVLFSLITPRLVIVVLWLFTNYLATAFGDWLWPTLGFFVLPTTTIAYAIAVNDLPSNTVVGGTDISAAGVIVIVLGLLIDLGLLGGGARSRRRA
jgi:hypothetical protein